MGQACACACGASRRQYWTIGAGLALAFGAEVAEWLGLEGMPPMALAGAAILLAGRGVLWQGLRALLRLHPNIYLLMTLASAGALALGKWGEAAVVLTLYALAELLEQRAAERSERSLRAALTIAPAEATVQSPDGAWQVVPVAQIRVGQRVRIKPGERVPIDGVVRAGASAVDQSPITGESLPVEKGAGDMVYAGSLNLHGSLEVEASTTAEGTLAAHIARVVAQAQARRAQVDRLIDRFAQVYTPLMLTLATGVALLPPLLTGAPLSEWLYRGLVFLVLGCPCALVISIPVTLLCALTGLARQGVVVKGAAALEQAARLRAVAFDKTGTLTHGNLRVESAQSLDRRPLDEHLTIACSLASHSEHPIAQAIRAYCERQGVHASPLEAFEASPGLGVMGVVDGKPYRMGNHRFVEQHNACSKSLEALLESLESQGQTPVVLFDHQPRAVFALSDTVRPDAAEAIAQLHALGVQTALLTGDTQATADAVAQRTGVQERYAELLPHEKAQVVDRLRQRHGAVGMAGDGVNDAPALASADVGISFAERGADLALETADIALMTHDLRRIPHLIAAARHAMRIIQQNLAFVLTVRAVFIALALTGNATLWAAIVADMGSTLLVIANAWRAGRLPRSGYTIPQ
ncbi:MAG: cation-translocating P-type ATPase [Fimbriimonadales bacterium]|nr:MAG: cadmium-translocating P-type ATPase [Fimbriimonadales bacterium]